MSRGSRHTYSEKVRDRNRLVRQLVKACAKPLAQKAHVKIGKFIRCGQQGCVYKANPYQGKPAVVKVSTVGDMEHPSRSITESEEHDDFRAAAKIMEWSTRRGGQSPHRMLPRFYKVGALKKCLTDHPQIRGPDTGYITWREDLRGLSPGERRTLRNCIHEMKSMERFLYYAAGRKTVDDYGRVYLDVLVRELRTPLAKYVWDEMVDLQRWLNRRGAMFYDVNADNLGWRYLGRGKRQIVVRDVGSIIPLSRARKPRGWSTTGLKRRFGQPLAGYDGGP